MRLGKVIALFALLALMLPNIVHAAEPQGEAIPWDLIDCVFAYGTVPVPAALLQPHVPAGFRPFVVSPAAAGTVTQLGFEVDDCASGAGLDGPVSPMQYASIWTPAVAPPAKTVSGAGMFVAWDVLVPDDARRDALRAAGAGVHDGEVRVGADLRAGNPLTPFAIDYDLWGGHGFRMDIAPAGPSPVGGAGEFAQYVPGDAGSLSYWRIQWAITEGYRGAGTITLADGHWLAQALGTTVLPAQFTYGTWDYKNGKIIASG